MAVDRGASRDAPLLEGGMVLAKSGDRQRDQPTFAMRFRQFKELFASPLCVMILSHLASMLCAPDWRRRCGQCDAVRRDPIFWVRS